MENDVYFLRQSQVMNFSEKKHHRIKYFQKKVIVCFKLKIVHLPDGTF